MSGEYPGHWLSLLQEATYYEKYHSPQKTLSTQDGYTTGQSTNDVKQHQTHIQDHCQV